MKCVAWNSWWKWRSCCHRTISGPDPLSIICFWLPLPLSFSLLSLSLSLFSFSDFYSFLSLIFGLSIFSFSLNDLENLHLSLFRLSFPLVDILDISVNFENQTLFRDGWYLAFLWIQGFFLGRGFEIITTKAFRGVVEHCGNLETLLHQSFNGLTTNNLRLESPSDTGFTCSQVHFKLLRWTHGL